jgi:hypothetical protein
MVASSHGWAEMTTRPLTGPETSVTNRSARPQVEAGSSKPGRQRAAAVLELQRQVGNTAVAAAISGLQRSPAGLGPFTEPTVQRDPPDAGAGDLDTRRPVGGTVPADFRAQVFDPLSGSARAQTILNAIRRIRGDLAFPVRWSSRGTYHQTGEIWLDRTWTLAQNIVAVEHEITHLHTFLSGAAANITTMGREEFVNAKMVDEVNAHSAGYVAHMQLGTAGAEPQGFTAFRTHLNTTAPAVLRERNYARIEGLAKTWVEARYRAGDPGWRTSNTDENYYTYWRNAWDRAHPGGH